MSTKKSLAFLSKLAVAASASALTLSATAADKYKWNNNTGDDRMANGDNWYVSGSDPKTYGLPTADDEVEFSHDTERYAALNRGETFNAKSLYVGIPPRQPLSMSRTVRSPWRRRSTSDSMAPLAN